MGCLEEYIGETGDTLRHRVTVHRQQIRNSNVRMLYVSGHTAACSGKMNTQFKIFPLYKMKTDIVTAQKLKETYFINIFKPTFNRTLLS